MESLGWRKNLDSMDQHGMTLEWETFKVLIILGILAVAASNYPDNVLVIMPLIAFITYLLLALPIAILTKYEGPIPFIRSFPMHFYIYIYDTINYIKKQIKGGF